MYILPATKNVLDQFSKSTYLTPTNNCTYVWSFVHPWHPCIREYIICIRLRKKAWGNLEANVSHLPSTTFQNLLCYEKAPSVKSTSPLISCLWTPQMFTLPPWSDPIIWWPPVASVLFNRTWWCVWRLSILERSEKRLILIM